MPASSVLCSKSLERKGGCKPVQCYLQRGWELQQCIMQHLFLQSSCISQKAWMAQLLRCILFHIRSFLPNRQLNLGACFPHLLFALCFYEFELNTAVKIICYLICVSVGIKADVFFLLMRKWANQYWQTPCLTASQHLKI